MSSIQVSPGDLFGRWTVLAECAVDSQYRRSFWCVCECGRQKKIRLDGLKRKGNIGCHSCAKRTHGLIHTRTYASWSSMKSRCSNPNDDHWDRYGKIGISVCERWMNSFEDFLEDMGPRPDGCSLDRYPDKSGNYEPSNCRWATPFQQSNNLKRNMVVEFDGRSLTVSEWSLISGISSKVIYQRYLSREKTGLSIEECIFKPLMKLYKNRKGRCNVSKCN